MPCLDKKQFECLLVWLMSVCDAFYFQVGRGGGGGVNGRGACFFSSLSVLVVLPVVIRIARELGHAATNLGYT